MKRKTMKNISKKVMAGFLAVAMMVTGVVIVPETVKAADEVYWDTTGEYTMSDYWTTTEKKAPVKAGYVFSGWYSADKTTALKAADLKEADGTAIARFVPAEVLSIKTQVGTLTYEENGEQKTETSLRILSTVDSTNYQAVGFEYKLATQAEGTAQFTKVYSKIRQSKGSDTLYEPDLFSGVSQYFIAADVSSISSESFAKIVYARPYWITMDGTKVMGLARNSRVEDKDTDKDYTSVGINLLPMETVKAEDANVAQVAAGKIQVKYNKAYYSVQSVDTTADNSEGGVGGTYLFPEMDYHIDETAGTITFVGNAVIQDGNLTNLAADGLFANVRFAKTAANTNKTALTLEVTATEFCNWEEGTVTKFVVQ